MELLKNKYLLFFSLTISICFQLTDVKIFDIKISELLMLLLIPFLLRKGATNKYVFYLFAFFSIYLLVTFILNLNREFFLNTEGLSILKRPYFISISRYIEIISSREANLTPSCSHPINSGTCHCPLILYFKNCVVCIHMHCLKRVVII